MLLLEQDMRAFYQSAIIGEYVDVQFVNISSPSISLSSTKTTTKGWNLKNSLQQVHEKFLFSPILILALYLVTKFSALNFNLAVCFQAVKFTSLYKDVINPRHEGLR